MGVMICLGQGGLQGNCIYNCGTCTPYLIVTSLAKEVMFLVALVSLSVCLFVCYLLGKEGYVFGSVGLSVCLFVCLFVCGQHYSKSYERIGMKFYGWVLSSTRKN